jgi:two-component system, chemotaxis family, protein-glutamate methylesterase/glutaminase
MSAQRKIRVLVVDDSAIVRKILTDALSAEADIEVVGAAPDPFVARDKILSLNPDVVTLDIEMPRMDGLSFLKKLMRYHPIPVIIISSLSQASSQAAVEALQAGAVEALAKPDGPYSVGELRQVLANKIRAAACSRLRRPAVEPAAVADKPALAAPPLVRNSSTISVIAIGASTGGTEAIQEVLMQLPANSPPIVIVQHIPAVFSKAFADRLNGLCALTVKQAEAGDELLPGRALIAPGGYHLLVRRHSSATARFRVELNGTLPQVCYQRPAVDVLFQSVAEVAGPSTVAAILTGMGSDGAQGMAALKQAGAKTIAQDEASCVVFGMPREAIHLGCVDSVLPLNRVASGILRWC